MAGQRLLIVDDEPAFGRFVAIAARDLNYEVEATTGGPEFQDAYRRFHPTTVVMDIVMPQMDGIELVQWLASVGCTARIIVISGFNPEYATLAADLGRAHGLPPILTLAKPVPLKRLREALA